MYQVVSATQARIHFGEILRRAQSAPVIVERSGKPAVVILSKQEYDRLLASQEDWLSMVERSRAAISARMKGRAMPEPAEMLRQAREIRNEQLASALR